MNIVYLHGFGSSPRSAKALALQRQLGADSQRFDVPALDGDDFFHLTMERMAERAESAVAKAYAAAGPVLVIGSSLGGYVAAWMAAAGRLPQVQAFVLVAPAFGFPSRWRERLGDAGVAAWRGDGQRLFYHFGAERELPLSADFLDDCERLPDIPRTVDVGTSVIHGRQDESVAWQGSYAYAAQSDVIELHLVQGDHGLNELRHERLIAACVRDRWAAATVAARVI